MAATDGWPDDRTPEYAHRGSRSRMSGSRPADSRVEARVELSLGDAHVHRGGPQGPATRMSASRARRRGGAARSNALRRRDGTVFALGGLDRVRIGRDRAIVVSVRMIQGRHEKVLSGSCLARARRSAHGELCDPRCNQPGLRACSSLREPIEYVIRGTDPNLGPRILTRMRADGAAPGTRQGIWTTWRPSCQRSSLSRYLPIHVESTRTRPS